MTLTAGEGALRWGAVGPRARGAIDLSRPMAENVAAIADAFGLALSSHLWHELSISLVGASRRGFMVEYAELIPAEALTREFVVSDGRIRVPDVPGHGVELTGEAMTRFAV